jgi:hypothetical protein
VIVHNLDIINTIVGPPKAHAELFVDPNAMLSCTITFHGFQPISWWHPQIAQSPYNF